MTKEKLQAGFIPFLVIAIIAVLAIGGGAYVVSKNKAKVDTSTQANEEADANANANANLGLNAKGSLRSLAGMGKNVMCTFESVAGGAQSSGTVYIAANGNMRGDFMMGTSAGAQSSNMMMRDGYSYVWSGSKGVKMAIDANAEANANAGAQTENSVDLDEQVDYSCSNWSLDESKFTMPSGVEFLDIETMMKGAGAGVDVKSMMQLGQ